MTEYIIHQSRQNFCDSEDTFSLHRALRVLDHKKCNSVFRKFGHRSYICQMILLAYSEFG